MNCIWLVRHGNTFELGECPRRIGSRTDIPLVQSGIAQAQAVGAWFDRCGIRFDHAFTGSLQRTIATAEIILSWATDPPPTKTAGWLTEIDHGPDENQPEQVVIARIGLEALNAWETCTTSPPGWIVNGPERLAAWRRFFASPPKGNTLLVTSNGAARFAILACSALHQPVPLKLRTGAIGQIVIDDDGPRLAAWDWRPAPPG